MVGGLGVDADVVGGEAVALLGCAVGHGGGGLEVGKGALSGKCG